jgi:ectoine hydroxylase-related dioxygenase (phytanoyl-CoA dioxygenase family)
MVADLALRHDLVGSLIQMPTSATAWQKYRLSAEQLEFFEQNGYVAGIRILDDAQVDQLRLELQDLLDPDYEGNALFQEYHRNESTDPERVLFHALGAWRIKPGFHDLLWNPAFTVPASQLLGGAVRFWHDQLFCKPARHGGVVAWHQDYSYWTRTQPMNHLTCWIGLDDSTWDNGCLQYLPGSHRWPLLPITGLAGDMDAIRQVLTPEQMDLFDHPKAIELKKGEAAFHHPLLVHGSFANSTERQRRATVINVFRDGTRSAISEPLMKGANLVPAGDVIGGQFYPLLFDPATLP